MATCDKCGQSGIKPGKMKRHQALHCKGRQRKKPKNKKRQGTGLLPDELIRRKEGGTIVLTGGDAVQREIVKKSLEKGELDE